MVVGDAESLRPDYGPATVWVNSAGVHRIGQDAIVSYLGLAFADSASEAARLGTQDSVVVSILTERMATAWSIRAQEATPLKSARSTAAVRTRAMFLLAKADGRWIIQQEIIAVEQQTSRTLPAGAIAGFTNLVPVSQRDCDPPRFPKAVSQTEVGGRVLVEYVVGANGRIESETLRVISSPHPAFDSPALETINSCSFKPARYFKVPVRQHVRQAVAFTPPGE